MRIYRTIVAAGLAAGLAAGCSGASQNAFQPVVVSGRGGATHPATSYEVRVGQSVVGDATVWTDTKRSASRSVDFRVEVKNRTGAPLAIDTNASNLAVSTRSDKHVVVPTPTRIQGASTVAPDATGVVSLAYELPDGVGPNDVTGLRLSWLLRTAAGEYRQSTEFVRPYADARVGTCPDYYGVLGYCWGWDQGQWVGYDNPADPGMPPSGAAR